MPEFKPVPKFGNGKAGRQFWGRHDFADHIDWSRAQRVELPNLKPSTTSISLRLPIRNA